MHLFVWHRFIVVCALGVVRFVGNLGFLLIVNANYGCEGWLCVMVVFWPF